ncbi:MAG: DNA polymerase III subunit delta [Kiritimatiellia bacterium]
MSAAPTSSARIFIFHGNDEFRMEQACREFLKTRCPNAEADGSLTTVRGDVDTVDQAVEVVKQTLMAVQSLNMFSPENVTWLREAQIFSGTLFKSETVKSAIEKLQETLGKGLGPEQLLLISVSGKLDKRSRFLKAVSGVAEVQEFTRVTKEWEIKEDALRQLSEEFSRRKMQTDPQVPAAIAARVGNDPRLMQNELEKLELFVGRERPVSLRDVEWMVPMQQEAQVYLLGDCVGSRDLGRAMSLLHQMETGGLNAVGVIATLHNSLREMA